MIHIFLAPGFEEIEALTPADILRRCGLDVCLVSVTDNKIVESTHNLRVEADKLFSETEFSESQALILPGGWPGAKNLAEHEGLRELLIKHESLKKLTCAICAAPMVLGINGLLEGRRATCYPGFEEHLHGAEVSEELVVEDGNIITGRGPGAAMAFGFAIAARFTGDEFIKNLKEGMIVKS